MKKEDMNTSEKRSRRNFIKCAGISTAAMAGLPVLAGTNPDSVEFGDGLKNFFSSGDIILFQGDSITDAGRDRKRQLPNNANSFGSGYAFLIAAGLLKELPEYDLTLYNRGISGNKVYQLAERWQADCIDLSPNVLSVLIGVNDYWHFRKGEYKGTPGIYENDFRDLLNRTLKQFPGIKLVICEPFVMADTEDVDESWIVPFGKYREAAARLASEFGAVWVPFQKAFDNACKLAPATYWAADGVHPSMAGCRLMAETWLEAVQNI